MRIDTQRTVAEIALQQPEAAAVFEKLGIDYCCNGRKSLAAACEAAGIDVNEVTHQLSSDVCMEHPDSHPIDWSRQALPALIRHIVEKHHTYCRRESARLAPLLEKVISKHGERHPELGQIKNELATLGNELSMHMMKEERMLFPCIAGLEESAANGSPLPRAPFGSIQNPVRMMIHEHDAAGHLVKEIRRLTNDFTAPGDACTSFRALYQGFEAFEADLHQHIHLENNLLFPRAIELENKLSSE